MGNKLLVDGVATTDHDTILQCWVDHFKKIKESKSRSNPDVQQAADEMENLLIQSFLNVDGVLDEPFSVDEIEAAVSRLKKASQAALIISFQNI